MDELLFEDLGEISVVGANPIRVAINFVHYLLKGALWFLIVILWP